MAARPQKKPQRQDLIFPDDPGNMVPPDTTTSVLLKTMMDMKESFGKLQSDIEKLHDTVEEVKEKQKTIDQTLRDVKTAGKTLLTLVSLLGVAIGLYKYGPDILSFLARSGQ